MAKTIRRDATIHNRLYRLAKITGRSKILFVRQLEEYFLAKDVLERIRQGKERTYSSAQVREELGLGI